jgi:hypothetical protein
VEKQGQEGRVKSINCYGGGKDKARSAKSFPDEVAKQCQDVNVSRDINIT